MFCLNKQTNQFLKPIIETVKLACYIMSEEKKINNSLSPQLKFFLKMKYSFVCSAYK